MDKSQQQHPSQSAVGDGDTRSPQPNTNLQVAGNRPDSDNQLSALMSLNRLDDPVEGAVGGIPDDDLELRSAGNVQELLDNEIDMALQKPLPDGISSVAQTACSVVSGRAVTGPKQSKKGLKLWNFWKRGRRSTVLPKCVETGEDDDTADVTSCISTQRRLPTGRDRQSPTSGNLHRLSMGAGSRSFGALMAVVPPAPLMTMTDNTHTHVFIPRIVSALPGSTIQHDSFDLRIDDVTAANPVGYPHLHFSQSLSTSSSSSSNSSAAGILVTSVMPQTMAVGDLATPTMGLSVTQQQPTVHTQVDYMHCLVPDLLQLTNCCFYWGVMDRYEAERLLDGRPEGTFLIRDSAQEEFLFSVSFRRYGRSLHARIEQWNHRFSFDSHDPDVFAAPSVCALVEHYKDPAACMFFEPMLTLPLPRVFAFTLQHLCRAAICSKVTYDNISLLQLPRQMQDYLKYYHYKQRICVRRFEGH